MKIGPSIPSTELRLMPRPRTTVGYSSEAIRGSTTKEDEMPIFPTQYNANVTLVSGNIFRQVICRIYALVMKIYDISFLLNINKYEVILIPC